MAEPSVSRQFTLLPLIAIAGIAAVSFGSYFLLGSATEDNMRKALLDQQRQKQIDNTNSLSGYVSSDLNSLVTRLQLLASQLPLQKGDFGDPQASASLQQAGQDIGKLTGIDGISMLDRNNRLVDTTNEEYRQFIGLDLSQREYVIEVRKTLSPYISSAFTGASGAYGVAIAVPVINEETGEYHGLLVLGIQTLEYFESYGNVRNTQDSSIVVLDREGKVMATGLPEFMGEDFFGDRIQTAIQRNGQINALYRNVLSGKPDSALFTANLGERFSSGSPVFFRGEQVMSVVYTTPTAGIYAQVDAILSTQRLQTVAMLASVIAAISALIVFMARWGSTLQKLIVEKTAQLTESNKDLAVKNKELQDANDQLEEYSTQLEAVNEKLLQHDKMQQEFVNIAAHELRTPIQPILGVVDLLKDSMNGRKEAQITEQEMALLQRNANRLQKLSSEILDATRIEAGTLKLQLETMDINEKIRNVVADMKDLGRERNIQVQIVPVDSNRSPLTVRIDRLRMFEVISNLLRNAAKYSDQNGIITVAAEKKNGEVQVSVSDAGSGIRPEVLPRLFAKFSTDKEKGGTGLGLYLAKNIIEAHGGRIWAENNRDGKGATFAFTLPLVEP